MHTQHITFVCICIYEHMRLQCFIQSVLVIREFIVGHDTMCKCKYFFMYVVVFFILLMRWHFALVICTATEDSSAIYFSRTNYIMTWDCDINALASNHHFLSRDNDIVYSSNCSILQGVSRRIKLDEFAHDWNYWIDLNKIY